MVIDSSAVIAILFAEPEKMSLLHSMTSDKRRLISASTLLEVEIVLTRRYGAESIGVLIDFLRRLRIQVVSFDEAQSGLACEAYKRFGRGQGKANLNFGDCFSYALAKQTGEPLLFKGEDFSETDLLLV